MRAFLVNFTAGDSRDRRPAALGSTVRASRGSAAERLSTARPSATVRHSLPEPRRLLCQADGVGDAVGVLEEVVDAADELSFEAANRFLVGLASSTLLGDVDGSRRVMAELDDREHVEGVVELAVAAGISAVAIGTSRGNRDRCAPRQPGDLRV